MKAIERGEAPGIGTGIQEFDDWCGGFRKRELITIAARTGMGKTTALLSIAHNVAFKQDTEIAQECKALRTRLTLLNTTAMCALPY